MPVSHIQGVRIAGLASAVPATISSVADCAEKFGGVDVQKISQSTGVENRHISPGKLCASDLCFAAARRILAELHWPSESVAGLVFVTQTPDFILPATSCTLHGRLGLAKNCAAFDVGMGCSGYVYGLWLASLMTAAGLPRVLLLVGDTIPRLTSPLDRSTTLLFGDAGTATALMRDETAPPMDFALGTDGSGWKNLIVPAGLNRHPHDVRSTLRQIAEGNNVRSAEDLFMDGPEIFAFTLREVSPLINTVLTAAGWTKDDVDCFVFHQANKFMLTHLAKSMKLPLPKVPLSLKEYGNTSSASIPLTINTQLPEPLKSRPSKLLLAGFGVGYSWGACTMTCGPLVIPPIVMVNESEAWQC